MYNTNTCPGCMSYARHVNPQVPEKLVDMIMEAMKDERADYAKYKAMIDMTHDPKVKRQINFAYEDEGKHYKMFKQILYTLTGQMTDVPIPDAGRIINLLDAIQTSIDGELAAVEFYRDIFALLPNKQMRDALYKIITDEQEHATRFTYLYAMLR